MADLTLTTFDWVPEAPRGFVRDFRVRWALEEVGQPYEVRLVPWKKFKELDPKFAEIKVIMAGRFECEQREVPKN